MSNVDSNSKGVSLKIRTRVQFFKSTTGKVFFPCKWSECDKTKDQKICQSETEPQSLVQGFFGLGAKRTKNFAVAKLIALFSHMYCW